MLPAGTEPGVLDLTAHIPAAEQVVGLVVGGPVLPPVFTEASL